MRKGFTLIELLIVMAVIAILVGIAVPRFRGMRDEANIAKAHGELRALKTAVESYYMHQSPNAYPATTNTLYASYLSSAVPKLIETVLYDPFAGSEYKYVRSSNGNYYVIYSVGVNGNGSCTISDAGVVTSSNNAIYTTNGE